MKCQYLQTQCTICRLRAGVVQIPCRHRADTVPARRWVSVGVTALICAAVRVYAAERRRAEGADSTRAQKA